MTVEEVPASRATRRRTPAARSRLPLPFRWEGAWGRGNSGDRLCRGSRVSGVGRRATGVGLILLVIAACSGEVATTTTVATTTASTTTAPAATSTTPDPLAAFARGAVLVSGESWDVAIADTADLRSQGLMGVTDFGDLDGMLFVFETDTGAGFWMKDTLIPLDVAFFAADGSLVDLISMDPCLDDDDCVTHYASGYYRFALEAPVGAFDAMDRPSLVVEGG